MCQGLKANQVISSHFNNNQQWATEVRGLGVSKIKDVFYTCSDDGTLREWSCTSKICLRVLNLNIDEHNVSLGPDPITKDIRDCSKLRVIGISPAKKGNAAAIGCYDGTIRLVILTTWYQMSMFRHRKSCVTDIKFSPNGSHFAVGYADSWICIYLTVGLKLISKIKKHSSAITHIDWSKEGDFIRSNCKANELQYFSAPDLSPLADGATLTRDNHWDTCSCVLSWHVQGIYGRPTDNPDISSVSRFVNNQKFGDSLLAVTDENGKVLVYRYPCIKKGAGYAEAFGHASPVADVCFSKDGSYLFSVGGQDNCVMQWKIIPE